MLEKRNVHATMCNLSIPGAKDIALNALRDAYEKKECIAVHCSGGEGRTGVILGLWVTATTTETTSSSNRLFLTPKEASDFVLNEAKKLNVVRKPNVHKINTLIEKGYLPP
jgi:protein-tyrosine phosphatase